ncbi:MAG TPA: hypothetical protein VEV16_11805, partial [Daejeonella sp.]|nr:hypothetical protein [Daejeonella sp.]
MKKSLFLLAWAICFMNSLYAQKTGSISGILTDGSDRTALRYATAAVYKAGDSVLTAYKLSDTKGLFKISNLQT